MLTLAATLAPLTAAHYAEPAYAHHAPAHFTPCAPVVAPAIAPASTPAHKAAALTPAQFTARRALIAERARALRMTRQHVHMPASDDGETFKPAPRLSLLRAVDAEPVLSPAERAHVRLAVEIRRDLELWDIGRAAPCYWLAPVSPAAQPQHVTP